MSDSEEDTSSNDSWPVTESWLQSVLKSYHSCTDHYHENAVEVTISNFTVKGGCGLGESILSDILAVNVDYELKKDIVVTESLDLIIKLLPQDPFSRFFVTEAQFDLREIRFYTKVVPDLQRFQKKLVSTSNDLSSLPIPICYHAQYTPGHLPSDGSPEPPESVLVLEDLRPLGYTVVNFSTGLNLQQAEAAITAIAYTHALSLCFKICEKVNLMDKYPFLFQTSKATESYQQLVERGLPQLAKFLEKRPEMSRELEALQRIRPSTKVLIEQLLRPREPMALITHTDFWCNNLLFKNTETELTKCAILDWQMVTYSRPTNDVALLLISSVPTELRREHTGKLLELYFETLTSICAKLEVDVEKDLEYNFENLQKDYKDSQLLALLLCVGSVDVALGEPQCEQRLLDVLTDLYEEGILTNLPNEELV